MKYRVNGGTWPCATHVSGPPLKDTLTLPLQLVPAGRVVFRLSWPLPTRSRPVHASRVTTIQEGCHPHWRLEATAAANGPRLRGSSVPTCGGNSHYHARCAPVGYPYAVRASVLLVVHRRSFGSKTSGQTSKIFFALSQCGRYASPIELARQFETSSYARTKFRLGIGDPCAQATVDLGPLNRAERLGPVREASVISSQVAQRGFPHPLAEQSAHTAH